LTFILLVFLAIFSALLAMLCWVQSQRLYTSPEGTRLRKGGALLMACACLSAGFADRRYHLDLPSSFATGTIEAIKADHGKGGVAQDHGALRIKLSSAELVALTMNDQLGLLRTSEHVSVAYDPAAMLVRTVDILGVDGRTRSTIDNRAANRHRPNPWMWAALVLVFAMLPRKETRRAC
jgi:hypothetical protein